MECHVLYKFNLILYFEYEKFLMYFDVVNMLIEIHKLTELSIDYLSLCAFLNVNLCNIY